MKRISFLFVILLIAFGCTDEGIKKDDLLIIMPASLDQNSSTISITNPPEGFNNKVYTTKVYFSVPVQGKVKKVTIDRLGLTVQKLNGPQADLFGSLMLKDPDNGSLIGVVFTFGGSYSADVNGESARRMEELLSRDGSIEMDFTANIPQDVTEFGIHLQLVWDITAEYDPD